MARVDVYNYYDPSVDEPAVVGQFDPDAAERFTENSRWDVRLERQVSVNPGTGSDGHQALYRTAGGKWVLKRWREGAEDQARHEFVADGPARTWLLHNEQDAAANEYFGGQRKGGRPRIGEKATAEVKLPDATLAAVDQQAAEAAVSRAEMLRRLIQAGRQVGSYRALGRPDPLWSSLREADDWLRENRQDARDVENPAEERVFSGTAYFAYADAMHKALNAARAAFTAELHQARQEYAHAESAEPEGSKALAAAWGRTMGLDAVGGILEALQAMLPMDAFSVMDRADMADPTEDLNA